jgi:putative peptidoglycan lipid II flippase
MPHGGLALANSIATTVEGIILLILVKWRLQGLENRRLLSGAGWAAASTVLMSASLLLWLNYSNALPDWLVLGVSLALGGIVFAVSAYTFGLTEVSFAIHWVLKRFRSLAQGGT